MSLHRWFISLCLVLFSGAYADPSAKFQIGSSATIISSLPNSGTLSSYSFPSTTGEMIKQKVDQYVFQNGYFSISGDPDVSSSEFVFGGDKENIYGWLVLRDKNLAYEYTTVNGMVYVEKVPITKIYPVCAHPDENEYSRQSDYEVEDLSHLNREAPEDHIKPWNNQDLYKLQSLPGSKYVMWLNIEAVMNGDTPKHHSKEKMYQAWQIFASSYSMFDYNVTTDRAVFEKAELRYTSQNRLMDNPGRSFCGRHFGRTGYCRTELQNDRDYPKSYGQTMSHESGHGHGLGHDGTNGGSAYFGGLSTYQWNTIMGNNRCCASWSNHIHQFSKGEYANANNSQDDFNVMEGLNNGNGLTYRKDDIPTSVPLVFRTGGNLNAADNRGQINGNANGTKDSDTFTFTMNSAGRITLSIDRTEANGGSALDVDASILDASGRVVAQDNKTRVRAANIDVSASAGSYRLVIKGGAEGTPSNGFSNYGTMGFYAISGQITGGVGIEKLDLNRFVRVSQGKDAKINLHPGKSKIENIALVSTNGAVVFHSPTNATSIDISNLRAGIYVLKMKINGSAWERKIVKN